MGTSVLGERAEGLGRRGHQGKLDAGSDKGVLAFIPGDFSFWSYSYDLK